MPNRQGDVEETNTQTKSGARARDYEAAADAAPGKRIRSVPLGGRRAARKAPWPAAWVRMMHFVLRPESWAEAMRHPLRFTLVPVVLAILLTGVATGVGTAARAMAGARSLAEAYDAHFAPISYVNGKLAFVGTDERPVRVGLAGGELIIDPSGKTRLDAIVGDVMLFGATTVQQRKGGLTWEYPVNVSPLHMAVPDGSVITSAWLKEAIANRGWALAGFAAVIAFIESVIGNALWAAATILLVAPVLQLSAAAMRIPQRVAYRGAAAIVVPLVALGGVLSASGFTPDRVMPAEWVLPFWFIASVLLACWTGVLAGKLYRKGHKRRAM